MNDICRGKARWFWVFFLIIAFALLGCQKQPATQPQEITQANTAEIPMQTTTQTESNLQELWILYSYGETTSGSPVVPESLSITSKLFQKDHPDITVRLEAAPQDEAALQHLRAQIMAGKGPDVYVIAKQFSSLISDPYLAMANGIFADISEYYDADEELGKNALNQTVMDAGIYDGRRYILPFLYNLPVAYVDVEQFEAQGGNLTMFDGGIINLYEQVMTTGSPELATGCSIISLAQSSVAFNFLSEIYDYENQEILLTEEEVGQFLKYVQAARAAEIMDKYPIRSPRLVDVFMDENPHPILAKNTWRDYTCMYIGTMADLPKTAGFSLMSGIDIAMIPVAAADGKHVANVSCYGAVGNGCEDPALAYEFLRLLLSEKAQWDCSNGQMNIYSNIGYPVRTEGSTAAIAKTEEVYSDLRPLCGIYEVDIPEMTDDDIPVLDVRIDRVHFYSEMERSFGILIGSLNDIGTGEALDVDIDTMAAEFIDDLKWHLAEG